jgi:hypothetical protein
VHSKGSNGVTASVKQRGKGLDMRITWRLFASSVAITALSLMAATTVAAANPNAAYTCVKVKENGQQDVQVGVPESAVSGLTNAGFTCVATVSEDETEDPGDDGNGDPRNEGPGDESGNSDSAPAAGPSVEVYVPQESRSVYCSTNGPAYRANGEGMGVTLNLLDTQGTLMVELGLARPASFYQGIGASCDLLTGFKDSGLWVDHIGDVVPGVAVYPLFVTA